jgi:hypothetical protein
MANPEAAARFEAFALMRLSGRSDVTYRAYDLLTKERAGGNIRLYLQAAGQYIPHSGVNEPLTILQRRFMSAGFKVMTLGEIETLLHEFWVYQRIKHYGKKNWPYRDPDEARTLYDQNEALKLTALGSDDPPDSQS